MAQCWFNRDHCPFPFDPVPFSVIAGGTNAAQTAQKPQPRDRQGSQADGPLQRKNAEGVTAMQFSLSLNALMEKGAYCAILSFRLSIRWKGSTGEAVGRCPFRFPSPSDGEGPGVRQRNDQRTLFGSPSPSDGEGARG